LPSQSPIKIAPAEGKLGVLIPGIGAVSTTFIAGVEAVKRGLALPIGSLTQLATIRLGKRTDGRSPYIKDFVPLAKLEDLVFGGWDIYEDTAYEAAVNAKVLKSDLLEQVKEPLQAIKPMKAVFDHEYIRNIDGPNKHTTGTKMDKAQALIADIARFKEDNGCSRLIMMPICGKDFKTGQTFMKTVLAPASRRACWASQRLVLDQHSGQPRRRSAGRSGVVQDQGRVEAGVARYIFQPELYPDLYKDLYHKIRINYYPPRGDDKEGWDNIDIFGWLGYPMQIKVNFLCRDSILAAPMALDLVLFMDLAKRAGAASKGIQEWLSFYLKSPQTAPGLYPGARSVSSSR
jgi:myo-inositol-1-phosphate synthase